MITFRQKGDFSKLTKYLGKSATPVRSGLLDKYGRAGVAALSSATPTETGKTASSWSYEVVQTKTSSSIVFSNSNVNKGIPIAIILQYGHGTGTGGYVQGRDYINPACKPVFDKLAEEAWREVTSI